MAVKVEHSVTAKCRPEHAWQKFQKTEEWPWWNRVIGQAKWTGRQRWQQGSRMLLELAYPKRIALKTTVKESSAAQTVALTAEGSGMSGTIRFRFDALTDGNSTLNAECEFSGWKTALSGGSLEQDFRKAFEEWLGALKTEAEKIAREELARS